MTESENRRNTPDRRQKKITPFPNNKRETIRREEDRKNLKAYYITLALTFSVLVGLGIASYLYQGGL